MAIKFKPARGLEAKILAQEPIDGGLWIATDTRKIYYSNGTEFVSMGGKSSIFYGIKDTSTADTGQTQFIFDIENEIEQLDEGGSIPQINDLILNSDGCFYRVTDIDDEAATTIQLTIAGSGGSGSGGGGGGTTTASGTASVEYVDNNRAMTVLYGNSCPVQYKLNAADSAGDVISGNCASVVWSLDGTQIATTTGAVGLNTFDVGNYLKKNISTAQSLKAVFTVNVNEEYPVTVRKTWEITAVTITLTWNYDSATLNKYTGDYGNFTATWTVVGGSTNNPIIKTTYLTLTGNSTTKSYSVETTSNNSQSYIFQELSHGTYTLTIYAAVTINGSYFETEKISHDILIVKEENDASLIALGNYDVTMDQYNTMQIPIYLYNTNSAILYESGAELDRWNNLQQESSGYAIIEYWNYTPTTSGEKRLQIVAGSAEKFFNITVNQLELNSEEITGYAAKIKASDFTSNSALKNSSLLTFSDNFDWNNGGLKTETDEDGNIRQYICVKYGTTMSIDYKLFQSIDLSVGKTFKFIFKVTNCANYDAKVISCMSNDIGLDINAQYATYKTSSNTSTTQYCEDSYIEYEVDIWPNRNGSNSTTKKYIMPWIDGVPVGITLYESDIFTQSDPQVITIGSEYCDVYLYLFKVYEKHLSDTQHLDNFIMDAPNASQILSRYARNNILSDDRPGEIDWAKLIENNPNCLVEMYDIGHMTKTKKDYVNINEFRLYRNGNSEKPVLRGGSNHFSGAKTAETSSDADFKGPDNQIKVQGTSSAGYVVAAANIDAKFKSGFLDADDNPIKKYALDDDGIGVNYFNTKVNVASCEGGNNAVNAEWYNKYQPYVCLAKKKNSKKRDTMEFKPGVMFILDRNTHTSGLATNGTAVEDNVFKDTDDYISNPYYKMYSVCNFGNSKKNVDVLHDPDNPDEVCIEVTDNNGSIGYWMTAAIGYTSDEEEVDLTGQPLFEDDGVTPNINYTYWKNSMGDKCFDARYRTQVNTDGTAEGTDGLDLADGEDESYMQKKIVAFFNLVNWFAQNDPCQYNSSHPHGWTGKLLDESEDFEGITFKPYTFKTTDWKNDTTVLGGITIDRYAGTYKYDTHEYRMAKLLSECEDHLIMDSFVYHYLFMERHSLVDNVAKNTFWTSEDENNQYWSLVKDYDNDTSDGNDNSGHLTLTYGYEGLDVDENKVSVFNAPDTVWFNFVYELDEAKEKMYENRNQAGAWNADSYLNYFEDWQGAIPERCWIEDYYRKYVRPHEVYDISTYLSMLEGGKKTQQRKQYETYQEIYLGTKYQTSEMCSTTEGNSIVVRANVTTNDQINIPIKLYSDGYAVAQWGQTKTSVRGKRGEEINLTPSFGNMNDQTTYFFAPSTYTSMGDVGVLIPKLISLSGASRLLDFTIGSEEGEPNTTLESISFTSNKLLRNLNVIKCANLTGTLNLSSLYSLQTLNTKGSNFNQIILPNNAPMKTLKLNGTKQLIMENLTALEEITLEDYSNVMQLCIDNCDNDQFNSLKEIVLKSLDHLEQYQFTNVNWKLDASSDNNYFSEDTEGVHISFLDIIASLAYPVKFNDITNGVETVSREQALTGTLIISEDAYNNSDSLKYYQKYIEIFPNLDIIFEGNNSKLWSISLLNGDGTTYYNTKTINNKTINDLIGFPAVEELTSNIIKAQTEAETYAFKGWSVNDSEDIITTISSDITITSDIVFKPVFESSARQYNIKVYDGETEIYSGTYDYGTLITEIVKDITEIPYKDDSDLDFYRTYKLAGYSASADSSSLLAETASIGPQISEIYTVFQETSVYNNVLDSAYYSIGTYYANGTTYGTLILKQGYKYPYHKLTLPVKTSTGQYITKYLCTDEGSAVSLSSVKYIFFDENNALESQDIQMGTNSFYSKYSLNNLIYIKLPENYTINIAEVSSLQIHSLFCFEGKYMTNATSESENIQYMLDYFFKKISYAASWSLLYTANYGANYVGYTLNFSTKLKGLSYKVFQDLSDCSIYIDDSIGQLTEDSISTSNEQGTDIGPFGPNSSSINSFTIKFKDGSSKNETLAKKLTLNLDINGEITYEYVTVE